LVQSEGEKETVAAALDKYFSDVLKKLNERRERQFGSAYEHRIMWHAVTGVEKKVGIIRKLPRTVNGWIDEVEVTPDDVLAWFDIKSGTYKGIITEMRNGQKVYDGLCEFKESGKEWLNENDNRLFADLKTFFSSSSIPHPARELHRLTPEERRISRWKSSTFKAYVKDLSTRYNIEL
jgi:hypothetical protein